MADSHEEEMMRRVSPVLPELATCADGARTNSRRRSALAPATGVVEGWRMASDAEWVEDVRRWYFAGKRGAEAVVAPQVTGDPPAHDADALGYEAADPALQARHWPDAPITTVSTTV